MAFTMPTPSYWILPIVSGIVWLTMLLTLLIHWTGPAHHAFYHSMVATQDIAYVSDVGAQEMKPVFIAGCVTTSILLNLSFAADRWLRHKGRLLPNTTVGEKVLSGLANGFALVGTLSLIFLTVFDTDRHKKIHDSFFLLFMGAYVFSGIFICWEYQRLHIRHPTHPLLRRSFLVKLAFVGAFITLGAAFAATTYTRALNAGAALEWTIAFVFGLYILTFAADLYPAARTKDGGALAPDASEKEGRTAGEAERALGSREMVESAATTIRAPESVHSSEGSLRKEMVEGKDVERGGWI